MYRDIMNDLIKWKNRTRRKPLIISGVRQCGKTFIIEEFGRTQFSNLLTINFEEKPGLKEVFDFDFDTKRIVSEISRFFRIDIDNGTQSDNLIIAPWSFRYSFTCLDNRDPKHKAVQFTPSTLNPRILPILLSLYVQNRHSPIRLRLISQFAVD